MYSLGNTEKKSQKCTCRGGEGNKDILWNLMEKEILYKENEMQKFWRLDLKLE